MRFFNKYTEEDNFRWVGLHALKTSFGFGFSFGKPIWWIPKLAIVINDGNGILKLKFGWLLLCFGVGIIHGYTIVSDDTYVSVPPKSTRYVKTKYIYKGKGKPLPYTRDI